MTQVPSRGYASSARVSNEPGAYIEVLHADFGVLGGAAPALAYNAGAGSLAMGTARAAITWITAQGESQASAEATVGIAAGSGAFTITQPTVPSSVNGNQVIGWRVYSSSGGAGTPLLNVAAPSTTQVQQNFTTTQGVLAGFPVATTAVQVLIYGAGQGEPTLDLSGAQTALPTIPANTTLDYFFKVPNSGSRWKVQKSVEWMRPEGLAEAGGLSVGPMDCINPVYPGVNTAVSIPASSSVPNGQPSSYFAINGNLYVAKVAGTTAAAFIGAAAFNVSKFQTVVDGTVTWLCLGKATLVRAHFNNASGTPAAPVTQEYDLFEA